MAVGSSVGTGVAVGSSVGTGVAVGSSVGTGVAVGSSVGTGVAVGSSVGTGVAVGSSVGSGVAFGSSVGSGVAVGSSVGSGVSGISVACGSMSSGITGGTGDPKVLIYASLSAPVITVRNSDWIYPVFPLIKTSVHRSPASFSVSRTI